MAKKQASKPPKREVGTSELSRQPKKKKSKAKAEPVVSLKQVASASIRALTYEIMKHSAHPQICQAGSFSDSMVGLPIPFPMEYLLDVAHLPLGYIMTLVGPYGCNKTSLKWEIMRWFLECEGCGMDIESESKPAFDLDKAIIGYPETEEDKRWMNSFAVSIEDWQRQTQAAYQSMRNQMDPKKKGSGRTFPFLVAVDSVMGKLSQTSQTNINDKGFADRATSAHGYEANIISQFLRKIPQDLPEWPFFLLLINQLKISKKDAFSVERRKAGGAQIDFQEAWELELGRVSSKRTINEFSKGGFEIGSNTIRMKTHKNSLGQPFRDIRVDICWWHQLHEPSGSIRSYTRWDWDTATMDLLQSFSPERQRLVKPTLNVRKLTNGRYFCPELGITKSDAISRLEMGRVIGRNTDVRQALRRLLGIKPIRQFEVGKCYLKQVSAHSIEFRKQMAALNKKRAEEAEEAPEEAT